MEGIHSIDYERIATELVHYFGAEQLAPLLLGDGCFLLRLRLDSEDIHAKAFLHRSFSQVQREAALINSLTLRNFPTAPLKRHCGDGVHLLRAAGRDIPILLTKTINGLPPGREHVRDMGARLGSFHNNSADALCEIGSVQPPFDTADASELSNGPLPRKTRDLVDSWHALRSEPVEAPLVLVHGDCRRDNWIAGADGRVYLIDFSDAHVGHACDDLGTLLHSLAHSFGFETGLSLFEKEAFPAYRSSRRDAPSADDITYVLSAAAARALQFHLRRLSVGREDVDGPLAHRYLCELANRTYRISNARGWNELVRLQHPYCRPYGKQDIAVAKELLDPEGWIDWSACQRVLLLGGGGGQHSLLLASLDLSVVVLDISEAQLRVDRETAKQYGFEVETICADQSDLARLDLGEFDLVFHAMSTQFVPAVQPVFEGVARCLTTDGIYVGHHRNPLLGRVERQFDDGYRIVRSHAGSSPWCEGSLWKIGDDVVNLGTVQFVHPVGEVLGASCASGLYIDAFTERTVEENGASPDSRQHLYSYVPSAFWFRARRLLQ